MLKGKYVLFTRIPIIRTAIGEFYTDPLWAKDLEMHFDYATEFVLCCPVIRSENFGQSKQILGLSANNIVALRRDKGWISVFLNFIPNFLKVAGICRNAQFVHSSGAGWSFPLSFYILPLKKIYSFSWICLIESTFWKIRPGQPFSFRNSVTHHLFKFLLSRCLLASNARIFTHSYYKELFLGDSMEKVLINPASWIDSSVLSNPEDVSLRHARRHTDVLHLVYPARLVKEKGVQLLFETIRILDQNLQSNGIEITIMGGGELEDECKKFCSHTFSNVEMTFRKPVNYGELFFSELKKYDFVLVPNLTDEQPRIVYDAFSQGVGVIVSDTAALKEISSDENALYFSKGDAQSFSQILLSAKEKSRDHIAEMGIRGLNVAKEKTHNAMHLDRKQFLSDVFG